MSAAGELESGASDPAISSERAAWWFAALEIALLFSAFLLLGPTTKVLHSQWLNDGLQTYTHGYLIAAICLALVVRDRRRVARMPVAPSLIAAIALAGVSVLWLVIVRAGVQTAHQSLLPIMLTLMLWAAFGAKVLWANAFVLVYFCFAIRIWDLMIGPLQAATTLVVEALLSLTGVPAYVIGNVVHLAAGAFEIADGCSGLHFFIVALALAALYGEINRDSLRIRFVLIGMATVLALVTNWVRVYVIVVAGYLTDMQHYLVKVEHYRFGWAVFAVAMVIFFFLGRRIPLPEHRVRTEEPIGALPRFSRRLSFGVAMALVSLGVGPLWNFMSPAQDSAHAAAPMAEGPISKKLAPERWRVAYRGADEIRQFELSHGGSLIEVTRIVYRVQSEGKELVAYGNELIADPAWRISSSDRRDSPRRIVESVLQHGSEDWVMWHFYAIDGFVTNRGWQAQLAYGSKTLVDTPLSAVIALRSRCDTGCDQARERMSEALAEFGVGR